MSRFAFWRKRPKAPVFQTKGEEFKYWKRYVESEMSEAYLQIRKPMTGNKYTGQKPWKWFYSTVDPVSHLGKILGSNSRKLPMPIVEPIKDWHYFKGDFVEVMVGRDKGKVGQIIKTIRERNWVIVSGLNKKQDPNSDDFYYHEAPLLINSEVKLVDPSDMKQTEVEWRYTEDGDRVRVSVRTGRVIPMDRKEAETWQDGISANTYQNSPKDTSLEELRTITFEAVNSTVEEDLLKKYNLYEPKKKRKSYWY